MAGLGPGRMGLTLGVAFGGGLLVRHLLERPLVDAHEPVLRGRRQLMLDFALFVGVGVAVLGFDMLVHGFPLVSGVKLTLGCATIGIFAAIDLALARERRTAAELAASGESFALLGRGTSVTVKFAVPALLVTGLVGMDIFLLVNKDLYWIVEAGAGRVEEARMAVVGEIAFVVLVLLVLIGRVILSFARNLRVFFDNETAVLEDVSQGALGHYVAVISDDEFGQIASHTNRMIDGLRERRRVKAIFGKMVSPAIAKRILESEDGLRPGGSRRRVALLFSDVRNFTSRTERSDAEEVVRDLNSYFGRMVAIVHAEGGVVDKFIGDGLMAAFGVDDPESGADHAVRAAFAMQAAIRELSPQLSEPIEVGIGVHVGEVIAGSIGSPERLEFTFIGDPVNTAARLESLTKDVGAAILVSADTHAEISDASLRARLQEFGRHTVKGKRHAVPVWGTPRGTPGDTRN